jgi:hypothetical protein
MGLKCTFLNPVSEICEEICTVARSTYIRVCHCDIQIQHYDSQYMTSFSHLWVGVGGYSTYLTSFMGVGIYPWGGSSSGSEDMRTGTTTLPP